MAIKYKHRVTKEIAEYDSVMGLFYVEGKVYKDTGEEIPITRYEIQKDSNWEYIETKDEKSSEDKSTSKK
jgi:hypothetical protein